jgi:L-fuconolactonase
MPMLRIDAHQHFWHFDPVRDTWIGEDMPALRRDFGPENLLSLLEEQAIDGCITVQSDSSPAENMYHLAHAARHPFIKGIVGWVDLEAEDIDYQLAQYSAFPLLKGFRHVLQGESQRDFMLRPAFTRGIGCLSRYGYTYDLLIYPDQLTFAVTLARRFPDQPFVLDHLAKPQIRSHRWSPAGQGSDSFVIWEQNIRALAACGNVYCKVSGMVTEADWGYWEQSDFKPYLDVVTEAFGLSRLMFGSDWPVCLVAASYGEAIGIVTDYYAAFTPSEKSAFFGGNASNFYHLTK